MSASHATILRSELARRLAEELPRRYPHWGSIRGSEAIPGGFSGATLFRVNADAGTFAVKLSPNEGELSEVTAARHRVIEAIAAYGEPSLFPRIARDGSGLSVWLLSATEGTFVAESREWLENSRSTPPLAIVMPDETACRAEIPVEVGSAFRLLARFHELAERVDSPHGRSPYLLTANPLPDRYAREWRQVLRTDLAAIRAETDRLPYDLREPAREYLARLPGRGTQVVASLAGLPGTPPGLRLCLRDAHRNNIAYREGTAAAFFDWDALRYDRRIGDYARLAASFGMSAVEAGNQVVSAIQEASPADELTGWEAAALAPLLATQIWLPPFNWLKWILAENRAFDDPVAAFDRLRETLNLSIHRPFGADET